jgi:hypothetical protein
MSGSLLAYPQHLPAIALAPWYAVGMKVKEPKLRAKKQGEKPVPFMVRLYKKHRKSIKLAARVYKLSEAEVIRRAIEIAAPGL